MSLNKVTTNYSQNTTNNKINQLFSKKTNISKQNCYTILYKTKIKVVHLIITRFMIEFIKEFENTIYNEEYIKNGIRVMYKYLIPSLENQSCKEFIFILLLGNKANISYIKSLINFDLSFKFRVIYLKRFKKFLQKISKGIDVLISTRIDYDDQIYYNAVNDVRKAIDLDKPIRIYGYKKGVYYFETNNKFYDFYRTYDNRGCMSIFVSLIIVLKKVNQTITVYNLGGHTNIRQTLLKYYKKFGIKEINYEPAIFENVEPKFIWVRQKYSGTYKRYEKLINYTIKLKRNEICYILICV